MTTPDLTRRVERLERGSGIGCSIPFMFAILACELWFFWPKIQKQIDDHIDSRVIAAIERAKQAESTK